MDNEDRIAEIRARLDAWSGMHPVEQSLTHPEEYVADISWLLDQLEKARASEFVAWEIAERAQEITDSESVRESND